MKALVSILLIALLSFACCIYFPWWSIAIVSVVVSILIRQSPMLSFITGFISVFLLWGGLSLWISIINDHILAHRVSQLILKIDNPFLLIISTALIGGVVSGFAALTGSYVMMKTPADSSVL